MNLVRTRTDLLQLGWDVRIMYRFYGTNSTRTNRAWCYMTSFYITSQPYRDFSQLGIRNYRNMLLDIWHLTRLFSNRPRTALSITSHTFLSIIIHHVHLRESTVNDILYDCIRPETERRDSKPWTLRYLSLFVTEGRMIAAEEELRNIRNIKISRSKTFSFSPSFFLLVVHRLTYNRSDVWKFVNPLEFSKCLRKYDPKTSSDLHQKSWKVDHENPVKQTRENIYTR